MEQSLPEQEALAENAAPQTEDGKAERESVEQKGAGSPESLAEPCTEVPVSFASEVPDEDSPRQGTKRKSEHEQHDENKKIMLEEEHAPTVEQGILPSEDGAEEAMQQESTSHNSDPVPQNYEPPPYTHAHPHLQPEPYQPHYDEPKHSDPEFHPAPERHPALERLPAPDETSVPPSHLTAVEPPATTEPQPPIDDPAPVTPPPKETSDTLSIHEKLREMGEISVKPVSKSTDSASSGPSKPREEESEVSVEIKKKSTETDEVKRITNLRKNIREVMDENQLDATTLAAQRQESERLARVQVQQKLIRDITRQMAVERHNNRTQNRVLSLLQGQTSILRGSSATERSISTSSSTQPSHSGENSSSDMYIVKGVASEVTFKGSNFVDVDKFSVGNLTPSVSIAPVRRAKSYEDSDMSADESEAEDDSDKKDVVEIVDSSSDDDCIVLSDDEEEEEETEDDPHNSGLHVKDAYNIPDEQGRVLINIGHPENEEDIFLAPQIARVIKPHQIGGVRFLYDNIIESTERFNSSTGFGCILAHSMGLGKTLQVVCFCDIFLRHTDSKSILCILPINTLQNWMSEFNMWLPEDPEKSPLSAHGEVRPRNFKIYVLNDQQKSLGARSKVILEWAKTGGVLLIGYELFRLLSLKLANKKKKSKKGNCEKEKTETEAYKRTMDEIHAALVKPGPDLVMCDEGHRIKNSHASSSVALKQIRSKRRIVLTGYPLQNNLLEYWCMVDFVRPNYLGTKTEFSNMFERPIQNGQCIDSTPQDIKLMRYRAHVLHSLLVGFVQRRSHVVLQNSLPQKEEYVILVRMTSFQRKLYNTFMNEVVRTKAVPNPLKAFAVCCKIWNHPDVLYNFLKKREADLDLELEEVEVEANPAPAPAAPVTTPATPTTSNRGRKKGTPNKTTKGVNKNGKTIPAVEVQPNQAKLTAQTTDKSSEEITIKTEKESPPEEKESQPADVPTAAQMMPPPAPSNPPANQSTSNNFPTQTQTYPATQANSHPPSSDPNTSSQPPPAYPPYPPSQYPAQTPPNPHYPVNYNPYNPYEYDSYYGGQYGNMYPPPPPQQYPNNPYDQSYNAQNNYWQNNYYGYNNPNPMNSDLYGQSDPSYAGLVPKATESFDNAKPPSAEEKSSEIVDLDTKEIKTVEASHVENEIKKEDDEAPEVKIKTELPDNDTKKLEKPVGVKKEKDIKKEKKEKVEAAEESAIALTPEKETIRVSAKDDGIPYDWAVELMKGYVPDLLDNSPKMVIFMRLLEESVKMGDRILVFSQSLLTLNLIERFLQKTIVPGFDYNWAKNTTYFRLDGSTSAIEREKLINEFNANPHVHLFLVSTRAGSLGINLVGANRVVVFDASWNPCHDTQAVCRVYRYGQKKPCFVYRIVMDNCLEKKIYDRQINKQGMSDRVVDECNPDAHLSMKEVTNLCYDNDEEDDEIKDFNECKEKYLDVIMQKIIELHSDLLSKEPFHHESLLVDRKEKKLSQAEKRLAQRGYEMEKRASAKPTHIYHSMGTQYRIMKTPDGSVVHRPVASVRPMQADPEKGHFTRPGGVRPTRWIPAEVWQRQGMTAQEMTLPLDVVIPTSSGDKSNIVLKAGQKVMVLKSPKGIYMQLETGKIIAIRTSFKMAQSQNNKEKVDDSDAGTSNLASSDDIIGKSSAKMEAPFTSPSHQGINNASNVHGNMMTGKQSSFSMESSRGAKANDSSMPHPPFKVNNMAHHRNAAHAPSTNNSKNFNVQNLIDGKTSIGSQNANVYSHAMLSDANRSVNNPVSTISKQSLYNAATKANYPRSNYSFTNALKQAHAHGSPSQSLMANVKPQMHDAKMWENNKSQSSKNAESNLPTITIEDDIDPPLREKVVYKPNLIERKMKQHNPKNMSHMSSVSASNAANYSKQAHGKNVLPHTQTAGGSFKGPDSLRQMQNVKPYNRQYNDQRNGSTTNKASADDSMASTSSAQQDAKNASGSRSKMPSIRNIPAPYPTVSMAASKASTSNAHNAPTYTQSSMPSSSQESGSSASYTSSNTQSNQDNSEYSSSARSSSQHKADNVNAPETGTEKQQLQSNPSPSASSHAQQNSQTQSSQAHPPTSNSASTNPSTNSEPQYSGFNHHQQNPNSYSATDPTYNYPRSDYQQSYSDMYASGPPNPYDYTPTAQHHPPQQASYPYGSYYDHQMYGNTNTQNYGGASSGSAPAPATPPQHSQYYSNYQPPPNAPPPSADPYNSYYNYPPYPPQTGQWQQ